MGPLLVTDAEVPPGQRASGAVPEGAARRLRRQPRSCGGAEREELLERPGGTGGDKAPSTTTTTTTTVTAEAEEEVGDKAVMGGVMDFDRRTISAECEVAAQRCDSADSSSVRHREDSGYAASSGRGRGTRGDASETGALDGADAGLDELERSASGTDSGEQSADEDDVFDGVCGEAVAAVPAFCCCEQADWDGGAEPDGATPDPVDLGTSVESCYSACYFYAADGDGESAAVMMDSVYSNASDRTLFGACACQRPEDCDCDLAKSLECRKVDSDSDTDANSGAEASSNVDADSESNSDGGDDPRAVSVGGLSAKMAQLIASVSEELSDRRRQEDVTGSFHASSAHRQQSLFHSLDGAQPCRVGNKELTKTFDTKAVLGVAFEQARQTRRMCRVESDEAEDFGRFARFSECSSEPSGSESEASAGRLVGNEAASSELSSSLDTMSDDYLLEALGGGGGGWPDRISFSSAQSDSSVEVLDLETTGDFPRHFRFAGGAELEWPAPTAHAARSDQETLAAKLRHVSGDSLASQTTVVGLRERELDAVEEIEVLVDEAASPPTPALAKRNLLHRFLDMTADLWAGVPLQPAAGAVTRPRATLARSRSTLDRRTSGEEQRRPRAATVHCRRCLKTRDPAEDGGRRASWQEALPPEDADQQRTGKSQSVETGSSSGQRLSAGGGGQPGGGPGMAQRSLDSAWPPSLSRGSSTASQPEKPDRPPKLVKHTVQEKDTLTSIAARFDCLPTEVMKANRLGARLVFPGQVLMVPSRLPEQPATADQPTTDDRSAGSGGGGVGGGADGGPAGGASVGRPQPASAAAANRNSSAADPELDKDCLMKYVKIKTRHITDGQGVVMGTLLVTPNCLMFDPNVSDPLVLEHGADKYCVMVPMDYIVSAALFTDIAHMKVKDRGNIPMPDLPAPEVYHAPARDKAAASPAAAQTAPRADGQQQPTEAPERQQEQEQKEQKQASEPGVEPCLAEAEEAAGQPELLQEQGSADEAPRKEPEPEPDAGALSKELTFPELSLRAGSQEEDEEPADPRDTAAFPKAFDRGLITPETALGDGDGAQSQPLQQQQPPAASKDHMTDSAISLGERGEALEAAEARSVHFSQRGEPPADDLDETKKQKVWKRLSHPLTWMESLSGTQEREPTPSSAPPHLENTPKSMLSNVVSSVSSVSSALASSPRYIVDLGSGLLSSLSPAELEMAARSGAGVPAAPPAATAATTTPASAAGAADSGAQSRTASVSDEDGRREGNSIFYSERSSLDRKPKAQASFGGYKNLVSMEERPSLFSSFDVKSSGIPGFDGVELIPKPSKTLDDPPLYLCLIMGKRRGRKIRKTVRILSYGEEKLRSEFWFSIPREKCDQLYHFIQYWAPEIYGSVKTTKPEERGFELVDSDSDIWECDEGGAAASSDPTSGDSGLMELPKQLPKQSWEVIKAPYVKLYSMIKSQTSGTSEEEMSEMGGMSEELRRALCSNSMTSMDMEFVPELIGKSELLTDEIRKSLCKKIPPRVEGHPWSLIFSSSEHGFSLKSLYRKTSAYECPMLLFVQDTDDQIFGALCSTTIHMSEHYYGTGETFLFTFYEKFRTFNWSGENLYFARGSPDGLEFGSGDGHYGLYLDGDLYRGRTQRCLTYNNEPLTGSTDFIVRAVELWALT